jgi:DNA repair exonuclease SbcCD ATPase subunit
MNSPVPEPSQASVDEPTNPGADTSLEAPAGTDEGAHEREPEDGPPVVTSYEATVDAPPIAIRALRLRGPRRDYLVEFTDDGDETRQLSLIAGEIATGKTTILEFIEYCLGAQNHPEHDEIIDNVRSAQLAIEVLEQGWTSSDEPGKQAELEQPTLDDLQDVEESDAEEHPLVETGQEALAEVVGPRIARYVLERAVGGVRSSEVRLYRGDHHATAPGLPRRLTTDPNSSDSVSQFLLRASGLGGLRLKQAPTQEDSKTSILSFRDITPLWFLTNRRMDNADLALERQPHKNIKMRGVVDYFFGVSDDEASALSEQISALRTQQNEGRAAIVALQSFLREAGVADARTLDEQRDEQRAELRRARRAFDAINSRLQASTSFADEARERHAQASRRTRALDGQVRERETLLTRLSPLRSQYADDLRKLDMLEESQRLFDALNVTVCPACQIDLDVPVIDDEGVCSLCQRSTELAIEPGTEEEQPDGSPNDVAAERRSIRARLRDLQAFIVDVTGEATALRDDLSVARRDAVVAQRALDDLAAGALAPFISERDALNARVANATAALEATVTNRNLVDLLAQREYDVSRVASSLKAALARQRELEQHRQSRDEVISRLSRRFARTLREVGYPKVDGNAHLDRNLVPYVRGKRYDRVGSSGAQTLAPLRGN